MREVLDKIQELFFNCLGDKTSWGRNDVKQLYKDSVLEVLKDQLDVTDYSDPKYDE